MDDRALKKIPLRVAYSKVEEAREALKAKAAKWAGDIDRLIELAMKKGDLEVAMKMLQWVHEHMPADGGVTVLDMGVDRPKQIEGSTGPTIQIGIKLGGLNEPKTLPSPSVIDITPEPQEDT